MNDPRPPSRIPSVLLVLILSTLAVAAALYFRPAADETDPALLESGQGVQVVPEALDLAFLPSSRSGSALVFYPGARIPVEAYAWLGVELAKRGHPVFVVRFPLNFAIFAPNRALAVERAHPEIPEWIIGGHSLGGAMAAAFAHGHPDSVKALALIASWPPASASLASSNLPILLVSASQDGLATEDKIKKAESLLPSTVRRVDINGGNHAQFGEYGRQKGDGAPLIDGARQREVTAEILLSFFDEVGG